MDGSWPGLHVYVVLFAWCTTSICDDGHSVSYHLCLADWTAIRPEHTQAAVSKNIVWWLVERRQRYNRNLGTHLCGLGQFYCKVWPVSSWRRALEHSLSVALSPQLRWSEMEWLVSLVWGLSAGSTLWNEWILLHVYSLYRNECGGFHVRRAAVWGWLFTLGTLLFHWGAVLRGLWVADLFHVLLGSFCFRRFVPEWRCHSSN